MQVLMKPEKFLSHHWKSR